MNNRRTVYAAKEYLFARVVASLFLYSNNMTMQKRARHVKSQTRTNGTSLLMTLLRLE